MYSMKKKHELAQDVLSLETKHNAHGDKEEYFYKSKAEHHSQTTTLVYHFPT